MQERFSVMEDPRQQGYVKHKLCDILTMVICGLDELGTVVTYIQNRTVFFKETFGITSVPLKATFSRVLRMIDGENDFATIMSFIGSVKKHGINVFSAV